MKNYVLGIFAVILAVSLSAYTANHNAGSGKFTTKYYGFTGSSNANLNNTQSWTDLGSTPPAQCSGSNVVCIVSSTEPTLSDFQSAIANAQPQSEQDLDNMDGVDIYSHKN